MPAETRFVAGLLHEDRTLDELRQALGEIESRLGQPVDIAVSCGLARRGRDAAMVVMRQSAELCAS